MINEIFNCNLRKRHTFGMDVSCRRLIEYDGLADLPAVLAIIEPGERWFHLGGGSNVLFSGDFNGTVLVNRDCSVEFGEPQPDGAVKLTAAAGAVLDDVVAESCRRGLWGIENLSGIPGTIGGAAVQNVGAYGQEISDSTVAVFAYDTVLKRPVTIPVVNCRYGYRRSAFKEPANEGRFIILGMELCLNACGSASLAYGDLRNSTGNHPDTTPDDMRRAVLEKRNSKLPDPAVTGSAGSYFKNPVLTPAEFEEFRAVAGAGDFPHYPLPGGNVKIPAAWLIEQTGWKGYSDPSGAGVWHLQPLVLVNLSGHAAPSDILSLEHRIIESVRKRFGIRLSNEVCKISAEG